MTVDAEWNAWYSGEYVPGYRKVPGVIYARRYRVIDGSTGYATVYEFENENVPETDAWHDQRQNSSPELGAHAAGHDARRGLARRLPAY